MNWARVKTWAYRLGLLIGSLLFLVQIVNGVRAFNLSGFPAGYWKIGLWSLAGMGLVVGLQIVNWGLLMQSVGVRLPGRALARGYVLSSLPKYIPGSIWGYFGRSHWLNEDHGVAHGITNLANLFEIEVTLLSAAAVILLSLGLEGGSWLQVAGALILPAALLLLTQTSLRFFRRKGWFGLGGHPGLGSLKFRFLWAAVMVSGVEWLILGGVILLLLNGSVPAIRLNDLSDWMRSVQSFTLAWLGGFFTIFVPGGLGVRELALSGLLRGNFQASSEAATLVAIASRLFYSAGEALWLGVGLWLKAAATRTTQPPQ